MEWRSQTRFAGYIHLERLASGLMERCQRRLRHKLTRPDGTLPETIEAQVEQVWRNIQAILASADMEVTDIVKITLYLTRREDYPVCLASRDRFLGDARLAAMSSIVSGFIRPDFLVEAEVQAAK